MNTLTKIISAAALIIGAAALVPDFNEAHAGAYGDYERGQECKKLRKSGQLEWYSIASGTVDDGSGPNEFGGFVTKACHTNEASCQRWVKRVGHEIPNLDTIETAYCKKARRR